MRYVGRDTLTEQMRETSDNKIVHNLATGLDVLETSAGLILFAKDGMDALKSIKNFTGKCKILGNGGSSHIDDIAELGAKSADGIPSNSVVDNIIEGNLNSVDDVLYTNPFDELGNLKPNIKYKTGEFNYIYETDDLSRVTKFETDDLQLTTRDNRLVHNPNTPGKLEGDHAGHLAGDRFGGSPDIDNLVTQSSNVNLSQYKKIENQWANAIENGKKVTTKVEVKYKDNSLRPLEFNVEYTIDGDYFEQNIIN